MHAYEWYWSVGPCSAGNYVMTSGVIGWFVPLLANGKVKWQVYTIFRVLVDREGAIRLTALMLQGKQVLWNWNLL